MSRPGIGRLEDLRGKRIGVEENASGALMLAKTLEAAGLTPSEIVKVRVTGNRQLHAYREGEVDALVSWEPLATQLQSQGARRLHDSSHFPGLILDVLVARADALERSPDGFRQLLAGYFQALGLPASYARGGLPPHGASPGVTPDEVRAAQKGVRSWISRPTVAGWMEPAPAFCRQPRTSPASWCLPV